MSWFTLAVISVVAVSISSILQRIMMREKKSDPFVYSFFFQLFCSILIFAFAFARGFVPLPFQELAINFFLEAILYGLFAIFIFKALKMAEASEVTILQTSSSVWTILVGILFLGETFSLIKTLGVLFIFSAIVAVSIGQKTKAFFRITRGGRYALLAALAIGLAFANDAVILRAPGVEAVSFTAVAFFLPSLFILLISPKRIIKGISGFLKPSTVLKMGLLGIFYSTSAITAYLSYQIGGNVSQISPISQSRVVLIVILAIFFLNERKNIALKLLSAALVTVGVILLR